MATMIEPVMDEQIDVDRRVLFAPRRFAHANIFVGGLERSMAFYHEVCGLEDVGQELGIRAGFLSNGNSHHDMGCVEVALAARVGRGGHVQIPKGRGREAGMNHYGWEMENEAELVAAHRRAVEAGLKIHRTVDHQISHSVYVFDPDGNLHEFYADFAVDWRRIMHGGQLDLITGQWNPGEQTPVSEPRYHADPVIRRVEGAAFHARRISHAVVVARNFPRMLRFFTEVAGLSPFFEAPDGGFVCLRGKAGGYDLALFKPEEGLERGLHHYTFEVATDGELDISEATLKQRGGAVELSLDLPTKRAVFVKDPDGIRVEFRKQRRLDFAAAAAAPRERRPFLV